MKTRRIVLMCVALAIALLAAGFTNGGRKGGAADRVVVPAALQQSYPAPADEPEPEWAYPAPVLDPYPIPTYDGTPILCILPFPMDDCDRISTQVPIICDDGEHECLEKLPY